MKCKENQFKLYMYEQLLQMSYSQISQCRIGLSISTCDSMLQILHRNSPFLYDVSVISFISFRLCYFGHSLY